MASSKILTNQLLFDELDLWNQLDGKSISEDDAKEYYRLIDELLDSQINESIDWLDSEEAEDYFFNEAELQKEIFDALEDAWDEIFDSSYESVDDLLDTIYDHGKKQGYDRMRETIRYTDADIQAIRLAKDYNYHLIKNLTGDLHTTVKNHILQGIITGENPYNLAKTLQKAGVTPLKDSPFTARQRATMIAKTETSRMQNTGMLQSYVNEGYTEVKLLTAEDKYVCTTCLEYAYKFNKDEPRVYSPELLEREKIHNIIQLVKGGHFPPFHPHCRCTYLTVWKSKMDAPANPPIINLTPLSVQVRKAEEDLPEPTKDQLMKNLRPAEREKYENYKRNIPKQEEWLRNNPDASPEDIAKHQKRLDFLKKKFLELKKKALGTEGNVPNPKPVKPKEPKKPKEEPKPKKEEPTSPKPTSEPPVEKPVNPTRKELEEGLTSDELKEYDDLLSKIKKKEEWIAKDPTTFGFTKQDIERQKELIKKHKERLEELKRKAVAPKPKVETPKVDTPTDKPKEKPVEEKPQTEKPTINLNETLDDLRKIVPLSDEAFDEILKWSKKRVKNKTRYGREYNTETGEFASREQKGREYICQFMTTESPNVVRITSMGKSENGIPSSTDFKLTRAGNNQDYLFVSKTDVWYIHTPENYGMSSIYSSQKDVDDICRNASRDARAQVMELVKQGKLSRDDINALQEAQRKFESDNLLKAFSTKEWQDKGFVVHRAKRNDITTRKKTTKSTTKQTVDTGHIDKDKLTYDTLKTPEEIAAFYDLEYIPEVNAKGKIVSQKFIDHMTYVDPNTGEIFNHKMELNFDSTFVGPNRRKAKGLIDTTNSGEGKYDQKEIIRIYKEAPDIYKFATGSIHFTGVDRYRNSRFATNELGNATPWRKWRFENGKYYAEGVNSIMIPYLPLQTAHGQRGTLQQTLYHEMSHCFDYNLIDDKKFVELINKAMTTGISREDVNYLHKNFLAFHGVSNKDGFKNSVIAEKEFQKNNNIPMDERYASWYGARMPSENWAETGSMAAISLTGNIKDAVMENLNHKSVQFNDWSKFHKHTLDYAINKIKSTTPSMFGYNSNIGIKTIKPKNKVSKPKKEKVSKPKKETPKKINPLENGKVKQITYDDYSGFDYKGPKTIVYEDGTILNFKKSGNPEYPGCTLDTITTPDGRIIKYKDASNVYDDLEYLDKQLSKEELAFADEFIKHYGTYAGQQYNRYRMGKLSDSDYDEMKNDYSFKWLMDNADKYDKILEKTRITEDIVTMRVKAKNYVPDNATSFQDPMYTSASAGKSKSDLIEFFGDGTDHANNWTYITITPKGTKGCRFQGNSIVRNEGSLDDDFEMEVTYKRNFKFDVLLRDNVNKIMILAPG